MAGRTSIIRTVMGCAVQVRSLGADLLPGGPLAAELHALGLGRQLRWRLALRGGNVACAAKKYYVVQIKIEF